MADLEAYLQRMVDIANDVPGIALASLEYPDEKTVRMVDSLPFVFIEDGEATYQKLDSDTYRVTRQVRSLIYVSEIRPPNEPSETEGRVTDRAILAAYTQQFMKRSRLQLNGSIMAGIISGGNGATILSDGGAQTADRHKKDFTALDIRHQIVYDEQISEV